MVPMLIDAGKTTGELILVIGAIAGLLSLNKRTRRVAVAFGRFGKAHLAPWQAALVGICLLVPGPLDELVILPLMVAIALRSSRKRHIFRRYMATAWNV